MGSVASASGDGIVSRVAAFADRVGKATDAVVHVPLVAEVYAVVVDAHRLRSRVTSDSTASGVRGELEENIVRVFLVSSEAGSPDVVDCSLLLYGVAASSGRLGRIVPDAHLGVEGSEKIGASFAVELSIDVAVSMERVVLGELRFAGQSDGSEGG